MSSLSLPYYAKSGTLPSALPTKATIESSQDILCEQSARKVVGVGPHFVVKYGVAINLAEGQNMLFVQEATSVPVPRVYALYKDPEDNKSYIIMERVAGKTLASQWDSLSQTQKEIISKVLRASLDQLRTLRSLGGYCSLGKGPLQDNVFWTGSGATSQNLDGPFEEESDLNNALIQKYLLGGPMEGKVNFYRRAFPAVLCNHPPVFTHGDFQRKNIIVYIVPRLGVDCQVHDDIKLAIIDWEAAGWYPSYWEYARATFACVRFEDDWSYWVDKMLDRYLNEWAWMNMLITELWS